MAAPVIDRTINYKWVGNSIRFFMGKGQARRRTRVTKDKLAIFERLQELPPALYDRAVALSPRADGKDPTLGSYINIRWMKDTEDLKFYVGKKKDKYTLPMCDESEALHRILEELYYMSKEETAEEKKER